MAKKVLNTVHLKFCHIIFFGHENVTNWEPNGFQEKRIKIYFNGNLFFYICKTLVI